MEFSESSYKFKAITYILLVSLVGVPVYFILSLSDKGSSDALYFVKVVMVFIACCSAILLIFIPKIRYHRSKKSRESIIQEIQSSTRSNQGNGIDSTEQTNITSIKYGEDPSNIYGARVVLYTKIMEEKSKLKLEATNKTTFEILLQIINIVYIVTQEGSYSVSNVFSYYTN